MRKPSIDNTSSFASPIGRGYFGVGVESISKSGNLGNLVRTSHAFGASFFFTVDAMIKKAQMDGVDTSAATEHMPFFEYPSVDAMALPNDCTLVGVELTDDAIDLPSFRHPMRAAYVLGPEKGNLSPAMIARCAYTVKIPMKFCINVGVAGALVIYDRMISLGNQAERPVRTGGPVK
jgi:tRNA G18 (ribose-2'-O)-methylase SpoU